MFAGRRTLLQLQYIGNDLAVSNAKSALIHIFCSRDSSAVLHAVVSPDDAVVTKIAIAPKKHRMSV